MGPFSRTFRTLGDFGGVVALVITVCGDQSCGKQDSIVLALPPGQGYSKSPYSSIVGGVNCR